MNRTAQSRYSQAVANLPWDVALGIVYVQDVKIGSMQPGLSSLAESVVSGAPDNGEAAMRRIKAFESFFAANGFQSPLGAQLEAIRRKEAPRASGLVQALLLLEMSTGLLMGAQDSSAIKGELLYDLAAQGETFQGMRKEVKCHEGELVLRDSEGIIAALFQGPDHRTRLKKETKDIVFFIFSVPGIAPHEIREGIEAVRALFQGACAVLDAQLHEK